MEGQRRKSCTTPLFRKSKGLSLLMMQSLMSRNPERREKQQTRRQTDKGALDHNYSSKVHEWLTQLRRVHFKNLQLTVNGKLVKPTNPLKLKACAMFTAKQPIQVVIRSSSSSGIRVSSRPPVWCVHFTSSTRSTGPRTLKTCLTLKLRGTLCCYRWCSNML